MSGNRGSKNRKIPNSVKSLPVRTVEDISFRMLIENSHDGITLLDKGLQIVYRSASAERITGWTEAERSKESFESLVHPDDQWQVKKVLAEAMAHRDIPYSCNYRAMHYSGSYIWIDCVYTNMLEKPGVDAIVCNFRDITERKRIEEQAAESARFVKMITDNLPVMIAYWDSELRCLFANKTYADWFEKSPDEMTGINKRDLLGGDEFDAEAKHIACVLNGTPQKFERSLKKNNKVIFTHTQYLPDKDGCVIKGFYSLIYDVTGIKRAEREVEQKTEQIQDLLENISDGFIALDKNMCYTYANRQVGLMLGRDPKTLIGKNVWDLFPEAVGTPSYDAIMSSLKERKVVINEDYSSSIKIWQENRVYPSGDGVSMFIRDITKRKQEEFRLLELNEQLQKHSRELAVSNAELEQFAYVASHDLQEPLRMITTFLTQLERKIGGSLDDKARQYINFAVDGAKRMRQIILDLLEFSRVGGTDADPEDVDLNQLVGEVLALYQIQIDDLHAKVIFEALPTVRTYKTLVRQVLQNLIGNSLKYHRPNEVPIITISATKTETDFRFAVRDNGIGIEEEYFEKIFIIFQRLHNKDQYPGTGMGLAIAKKIIEHLGGTIRVDHAPEHGSIFSFILPKEPRQ